MKLFGKELFNFKKKTGGEKMWDFAQFGLLNVNNTLNVFAEERPTVRGIQKIKKAVEKPSLTPKEILKLGSLNDNNFSINIDPKYINEQITLAEEKLGLYPKEKKIKKGRRVEDIGWEVGPVKYGREELRSIIEKLGNRSLFHKFKDTIKKYPHTTSALIEKVLKDNKHLQYAIADNFVPDFPSDAVKAMKEYNKMCMDICGKKTNFYVLAKEEDFQKQNKRRDPILMAQSPFGFFWQILGAWDEEMIYLGDL